MSSDPATTPTTASTSDEEDMDVLSYVDDEGHEEQGPANVAKLSTRAVPRKKATSKQLRVVDPTTEMRSARVKPRAGGGKGKTVPKKGIVRFGII